MVLLIYPAANRWNTYYIALLHFSNKVEWKRVKYWRPTSGQICFEYLRRLVQLDASSMVSSYRVGSNHSNAPNWMLLWLPVSAVYRRACSRKQSWTSYKGLYVCTHISCKSVFQAEADGLLRGFVARASTETSQQRGWSRFPRLFHCNTLLLTTWRPRKYIHAAGLWAPELLRFSFTNVWYVTFMFHQFVGRRFYGPMRTRGMKPS